MRTVNILPTSIHTGDAESPHLAWLRTSEQVTNHMLESEHLRLLERRFI